MASRKFVSLLLIAALTGCSSLPNVADVVDKPSPGNYLGMASHNKMIDHPSAAVHGPAGLGLGIGTIVGIPIMIVALPVTLAFGIAAFTDDPRVSNLEVLGHAVAWPDAACAVGGAYAFGAVPHMIVGEAPPRAPRRASRAAPPPPLDPPSSQRDDLAPN